MSELSVPITIKDNIEVAGVICTSGTKGLASFVPAQNATIVERMCNAGAIILGKTNLPELVCRLQRVPGVRMWLLL